MQINHNQCRHIPNFDLIFWKNAVIDAACRRRMLRNTTWSQCWSSRAMKAMETFTNIWCIIFVMKLNLSKDVQLLRRTLIRLGYLTWLCSDPALGNTGLFAQPISGRNGSQAFSRCCKGRLEHAHDKSLNWPNLHIGKVRAVASVHRQAEKDPAMSLADQKSVWYIYIYIVYIYIYIYISKWIYNYSFLSGAAPLATFLPIRSSAPCYQWVWGWTKAWKIRWNPWLLACQQMGTWWRSRIRHIDFIFQWNKHKSSSKIDLALFIQIWN